MHPCSSRSEGSGPRRGRTGTPLRAVRDAPLEMPDRSRAEPPYLHAAGAQAGAARERDRSPRGGGPNPTPAKIWAVVRGSDGRSRSEASGRSNSALTQQAVCSPECQSVAAKIRVARTAHSRRRMPRSADRLVHDAADGARAAAALGAAAEIAIDLSGRERPLRLDGGADILIAQHIARTNDHGAMVLDGDLVRP